jgi:hypothetical protein
MDGDIFDGGSYFSSGGVGLPPADASVESPFAGLMAAGAPQPGAIPFRSPSEPPPGTVLTATVAASAMQPYYGAGFFAPEMQQQSTQDPVPQLRSPKIVPVQAVREAPAALQSVAAGSPPLGRRQEAMGLVIPIPQRTATSSSVSSVPTSRSGGGSPTLMAQPLPSIGIPSKVAFDPIHFPVRMPAVGLLNQEQQAKLNRALSGVLVQLTRLDTAKLFHETSSADAYPIVIDLKSVRDRIHESLYHSLAELAADVRLMALNARKFFTDTPKYGDVVKFEIGAQRAFEKYRLKLDPLLAGDLATVYSMTFDEMAQNQSQSEQQQQSQLVDD